jgi:hypothetical protein
MTADTRSRRLEVLDLARGAAFLVVLIQHRLGISGLTLTDRLAPQDATILDFFFISSGSFASYACDEKHLHI